MSRTFFAFVVSAGLAIVACTRPSDGTAGATAPTTSGAGTAATTTTATTTTTTESATATAAPSATGAPSASASAHAPFTAPTFHAVTCPAPPAAPPPTPGIRGCEHCPAGQYCREYYDHGGGFGSCEKNACRSDADCKGALCNCALPSSCYPGNCRTSADCGGRDCVPDRWRYGHGQGVYCRTDKDTCKSHGDCKSDQECAYLGDHWGCRPTTPAPPPG